MLHILLAFGLYCQRCISAAWVCVPACSKGEVCADTGNITWCYRQHAESRSQRRYCKALARSRQNGSAYRDAMCCKFRLLACMSGHMSGPSLYIDHGLHSHTFLCMEAPLVGGQKDFTYTSCSSIISRSQKNILKMQRKTPDHCSACQHALGQTPICSGAREVSCA